MNQNYLLDREFFNIDTRNEKNNNKKEQTIIKNNLIYMDRNEFKNQKPLFTEKSNEEKPLYNTSNYKEDEKDKKIQNMRFNPYLTQYRMRKNVDRIGYDNKNEKEQIYYSPYERNNIKIENKNLNNLDFIDKNKKTDYYKNVDLNKFNPNINYKNFFK